MEKQGRRVLKLKQNFVAGKVAQGKTLKKQLTPWKLPRQLAKKLSSQQTRISTEANQGFQESWKSQEHGGPQHSVPNSVATSFFQGASYLWTRWC